MRHGMVRVTRFSFLGYLAVLLALPVPVEGAAGSAPPPSPGHVAEDILLNKLALTVSYSPRHKQPDWVFYPLGRDQLEDCYDRTNQFSPDPAVPREDSAQLEDYRGSGFDRGHLSPAADNKWSRQAMEESFLLSNISPQPGSFNRGIWARLEGLVRAWASRAPLWVTTGPVLEDDLPSIGRGQVSVPRAYYKVLVSQEERGRRVLALLLPTNASGDLSRYALSVDELEESTRLDFNEGMADEAALESENRSSDWDFRAQMGARPACEKQGWIAPQFFRLAP